MPTHEQTLERAIRIAVRNGWKGFEYEPGYITGPNPSTLYLWKYYPDTHTFMGPGEFDFPRLDLNELIFNHDFAKALWGEGKNRYVGLIETGYYPSSVTGIDNERLPIEQWVKFNGWQYHLQQMVIAEDPVEYLATHLPGDK